MATIYEIAKKVGLSPSTVARALRGSGYCSAENREKILKVAKEMDYRPSYTARALKNKKTEKILFCIPDIYNPFYFNMIKGVNDVLDEHEYFSVLYFTKGKLKNELKILRNLHEGYGDGMILVSFDFNEKNINAINKVSAPVVLTNFYDSKSSNDNFDCVYVNTLKGIYDATKYFIDKQNKHIAYIGGNPKVQTGRERREGFLLAMKEHGLSIPKGYVEEGDFSKESGYLAMERLLSLATTPEAVVVANDLMAVGSIAACEEKGFKVPEDIAIIGMDNSELAQILKISSIKMQEEKIGRYAAELLLERIIDKRKKKKIVCLETSIVFRESSEKILSY